ncbi:DUF2686 family protein [Escherichia albertii]|uniref:DUF2686 family protein n=1 Tax=Escherichia albertii TaxID=208962 RepID=UPI001077B828|nr:DUF2686 family protein [Escherichia albertii]EFA6625050.1 DUF2686 family protein [Escherichia albertii]EFA7087302.1 DUF2686 family protein [Escherichia albertii]EFF0833985.1 DUF2686 family protein [Escherichia albertii]EFF1430088.1 DUF2686 family protein [Escherichia albertii]EFL5787490.1 DUF2686 family protein [Escherichia albertii]
MSIPGSNSIHNLISTTNHFAPHPEIDNELLCRYKHARLNTENIYVTPLERGDNHNYDGGSVVEIRKLMFGNQGFWSFNYVTDACQKADGVTVRGRVVSREWEITSELDEIYGGKCEKTHVAAELNAGLRQNIILDSIVDYTIHEITLGPGCNIPGYAGTTIGYIVTLPVERAPEWSNEQPQIDIYIDQIMTVTGVSNSSGFVYAALLNANPQTGINPTIGLNAYPDTAPVHSRMGYEVIPGDENMEVKRMTLRPANHPELFELNNCEWKYISQ